MNDILFTMLFTFITSNAKELRFSGMLNLFKKARGLLNGIGTAMDGWYSA